MKVINKKICLEQFTSRTPAMIDSFKLDGVLVDLSHKYSTSGDFYTNKIVECFPNGDYGMIPCDILMPISKVEEFGINTSLLKPISGSVNGNVESYSDIRYSTDYCDDTELKYYAIPYGTLKSMYMFFIKYNDLLEDEKICNSEICNTLISSATKYWEVHVQDESSRTYYEELDNNFKEFGGAVEIVEKENNGVVYNTVKISNMDDFVMNKIFTTFLILKDYREYWKCDKLYFIEALKWYFWFDLRYSEYTIGSGFTSSTDCSHIKDVECCDCAEYFNRGGVEMYNALKSYIDSFECVATSSASTSIDIPIYIQNSIDDMGEFSIFSEDWEGGKDYRKTINDVDNCNGNISVNECEDYITLSGGTTVIYNDDTWLKLCNNLSGSTRNECELYDFDYNAWVRYVDAHVDDDEISDTLSYDEYAYNSKDKLFLFNKSNYGANTSSAATEMSIEYDVVTSKYGFVPYNNHPYEVMYLEYVIDPSNKNNYLFVDESGRNKTITFNGKIYVASINDGRSIFNFTRIPCINPIGNNTVARWGYFIKVNGKYIKSNSKDVFFIRNYNYPRIDSYFEINGKQYYLLNGFVVNTYPKYVGNNGDLTISKTINYELGNNLETSASTSNLSSGYVLNNNSIYIYKPYEIYQFGVISGTTSSKLGTFMTSSTSCDDLGNILNGTFEIKEDGLYAQPLEDSILDINYKVGNTARLTALYGTDDYSEDIIAFWGDYLQNIEFYYEDYSGNKTSDVFSVLDYNGNNLEAIEKAKESWKSEERGNIDVSKYSELELKYIEPKDNLMAKFTYYTGAILSSADTIGGFQLFSETHDTRYAKENLNGIKYVEYCTLKKMPSKYYMLQDLYYNVYYYDVVQKTKTTKYINQTVEIPIAYFEVHINTELNEDWVGNKGYISMSRLNGLTYSPIIREEYKFGISSLKNIEENIYIDRQIIKPLEKNLRLLDIANMDALEKYGNGTIKIIST